MEESGVPDSKRRRTVDDINSITQLPHDFLSAIADYLPQISRGLLAVALTAPSASFHTTTCSRKYKTELSDAGKAVLSSIKTPSAYSIISLDRSCVEGKKRMEEIQKARWEILDFSDIDDLAGKLSDDDIGALLVSIKAKKKLKVLNVASCSKLVGGGLWPIGGSTILERINLPLPTTCKPLSIETISNILQSIIDASDNPLDRVALVKDITCKLMKCDDRGKSPIKDFILELNQLLINVEKCEICEESYEQDDDDEPSPCDVTCFECYKCLCYGCIHHDIIIEKCDNCGFWLCRECDYFAKCTGCDSNYCSNCAEYDDVDAAVTCRRYDCEQQTCFECKPYSYGCGDCLEIHTSKLENKIEKLTDENEQVKEENEQLRKEVEELRTLKSK